MNLAEQIRHEVGTPPPPSFDLDTLMRQHLERRARNRRFGIGAGTVIGVAVAATVAFALGQPPVPTPSASPSPSPTATPIPLPTRSWPVIPLPTSVPPGQDAILASIGPSLGVPDGTHFVAFDNGGPEKSVDAGWGPYDSWGSISLFRAADAIFSCEHIVNCVEVTGDDGSMTYVTGPIVASAPPRSVLAPEPTVHANLVWSYHPDGTFVEITIDVDHTPPDLTIATLVAAGQAFSLTS